MGYQRGQLISENERAFILGIINEACKSGARQKSACKIIEITPRTLQRWKKLGSPIDGRTQSKCSPPNKLSEEERQTILKIVNTSKYANSSPAVIVPKLADEGLYLASESTIYRYLKAEKQVTHRFKSNPRSSYKPKALCATQPNEIYSWDITYLPGSTTGLFFYLYMVLDIYSRKIVGWQVYERENSEYAADLIKSICLEEKINPNQVILHSDNGAPMKGATMLIMLQRLGIIPSFSRPGVSNDNPYSEALFRTLKYRPIYPEKRFETVKEARKWVSEFVQWYNEEHFHSGIKFITPQQRHEGKDDQILEKRKKVYEKARQKNPQRWTKRIRNWDKIKKVQLNPEKGKSNPISKAVA